MENDNFRFAVYLIPPYSIAQKVANVHSVLRKQFGFIAAGQFQVHATIKGFFKKIEGDIQPMVERLDDVFAHQSPIPVQFNGYRIDKVGIGLNITRRDGRQNQELARFRERVVDAVRPFIAPDCDFVEKDLGAPFAAHITLAFRDIPVALQEDVLAYLQEAELPTEPFSADTFHLLQFFSQDWPGDWEQTLTWKLLKSWRLPASTKF